jgi:hypothetical protein
MDPFLEHPDVFPDLHNAFITFLQGALQPVLPEPYYAATGRRVWVEVTERPIGPDVNILRPQPPQRQGQEQGGLALAPPRSKAVLVQVPHDERGEPFVEIYTGPLRNRRLVTTIEVLSPTNKTPGQHGRELYLQKQREILDSQVHLVEIDLLRGGVHSTAVPRDRAVAKAGPFDYHACVHAFDRWQDFVVYPILLHECLPAVSIPLLPGDPPVTVDLQAVFARCYDAGPYGRELSYQLADVVPALRPEHAAWAGEILQAAGLGV